MINVGLIGCGTVGSGVVKLLAKNRTLFPAGGAGGCHQKILELTVPRSMRWAGDDCAEHRRDSER